jgi:hypothetical protein
MLMYYPFPERSSDIFRRFSRCNHLLLFLWVSFSLTIERSLAACSGRCLQKEARELARDARVLQKAARAPAARREAEWLQGEAEKTLAEAEALKLQARLEDLTVWEMEKVKQSRKGSRIYSYWMAT